MNIEETAERLTKEMIDEADHVTVMDALNQCDMDTLAEIKRIPGVYQILWDYFSPDAQTMALEQNAEFRRMRFGEM